MEKCPYELLERIAKHACVDGGYTGRSLSLVSRYVRAATKEARYHSIILVGWKRVTAFGRMRDEAETKPIVRHLLILLNEQKSGDGGTGRREVMKIPKDEAVVLSNIFADLISAVAANLETLAIHGDILRFTLFSNPITVDFPSLTRLSVPRFRPPPEPRDRNSTSRFPVLTHLHVCEYKTLLHKPLEFWHGLAQYAPSLTHLRLSHVRCNDSVYGFLQVFLGLPALSPHNAHWMYRPGSQSALEATEITAQLPHLRNVCVQLGASEVRVQEGGWCGTQFNPRTEDALREMAERSEQGLGERNLRLVDGREYTIDQARDDWMDSVNGGDGAWTVLAKTIGTRSRGAAVVQRTSVVATRHRAG